MPQKQAQPRYAVIKTFLRDKVESQEWAAGMQIPSEQALTEMFSVSRMTARRAVKELTDEGFFTRTRGLGSFVSQYSAAPPGPPIGAPRSLDTPAAASSPTWRPAMGTER